ncbi:hypothetical protein [Bradyrhizobium genosp. A]|uniref:hypothetical protein n=1 Tax=Bradyrhizobium genosp. A TaxID=83626 RepID=UPI003CF01C78
MAQQTEYRPASAAPAAWQAFAKLLLGEFEHRLAGDDEEARKFRDYMMKRDGGPEASAQRVIARTWIRPDGRIERIEFDGLDDSAIAATLRALLGRGDVGVPPADMLQPLRLRLSPRPKEQPAGDK